MKIKIISTVLALLLCTLIGCSSDSQASNESPLTPDGKIKTYRFELDGGLTYLVPQTWEYEETDDGYNHYPPNKDGFLITSASKTETEMPADTVLLYDPEELTKTMWGDIWTNFQFKEKETYYISDRAGMALRLTCVNEEGNKLDAVVSAITNKNYIYTFLFGTIDNMDGTVIGENFTKILDSITVDGVKGRKIVERVNLTSEESNAETDTKPFNTQLISGHYTVGVDIPAGTYDFTAIHGGGNVHVSSGAINLVMGVPSKNTDGLDLYEEKCRNVPLNNGDILSVLGVELGISSKAASKEPLLERNQAITEAVELSTGTYVSGTDFPPGVYTITAVEGGGIAHTSNGDSYGINEAIGVAEKNRDGMDLYVPQFNNVSLPDRTILYIEDVTVRLEPSA